MSKILSDDEVRKYYKYSIWARPILTYSLTVIMIVIALTVCALLWTEKATISDCSNLLLTIIAAIAPILTGVVVGKSYERAKGVTDSDIASAAPTTPAPSDVPASSMNPLDRLNSMDLDDFMPKVADDVPEIK